MRKPQPLYLAIAHGYSAISIGLAGAWEALHHSPLTSANSGPSVPFAVSPVMPRNSLHPRSRTRQSFPTPSNASPSMMNFFSNRIFPVFFVSIVGGVIAIFGLQAFLIIKGVLVLSSVGTSHGIKPAVEQLWCGKPNCLRP